MENLLELQQLLLDQFMQQPFYKRAVFEEIKIENHATGILGARGIGKTTFLLSQVLMHNKQGLRALYVSADHVHFIENSLLDLMSTLYKETDIRILCIDEIHKYPNWQQELKNLADFYPEVKIIFTGSSMIDIVHSQYDLSRRVTLYRLYGFSFREYLEFSLNLDLPTFEFQTLLDNPTACLRAVNVPKCLQHFREYLQSGYFPFSRGFSHQTLVSQAIDNVVQKTIYEDIGSLHTLKTPTLLLIEKLYKYIVYSQPGELNAYKLASALSKDFENISGYLHYLEQAGLVRALYKHQSGKAALRNPTKLYPENTNFIYASYLDQPRDMILGKARETFALNQLQNAGLSVYYTDHGNFEVDGNTLEIGGKNKSRKQIKAQARAYILADGILAASPGKIPLYLLGFLR